VWGVALFPPVNITNNSALKNSVMKEVWKDAVGYEGVYQISSLGRVKSLSRVIKKWNGTRRIREKIMKPFVCNSGYLLVGLYSGRDRRPRSIHQLVAEAFLGHAPNKHKLVINHKNNIKADNTLENLEIVTQRQNANKKHLKHSSKYTGVYWVETVGKWRGQINIKGKKVYLGYFVDEKEAGEAYEKRLRKHLETIIQD
jgi:hypothetical protein